MAATPIASVIIPTLSAPDYLDVTLASVTPQAAALRAEVLVISDGPDAATAAVTARHGAQLVALPERRGLNSARNTGIDSAHSDLLVFIDQDVDAPAGWLAAILEGAERYPEYEVFGGPIRGRLESGLRGCGREPPPISTLDAGPADCDIPLVWGANMIIRRSAFDRVGRFDESLHGRGNENDWELRYQAAGGTVRYLAAAGLDHRRTAQDSRLRVLVSAAYGQGREARRHDVRVGQATSLRWLLRVLAGCAWHTLRRRCPFGIVMGARAAGSLREAITDRFRPAPRTGAHP